nr:hypothetical protein [Gordonia jinghuaiqii]
MPVSPHGEATVLRSERVQWQRRENVAAESAAELDSALRDFRRAVKANYLGDCVEGIGLHDQLRSALSSLTLEISNLADEASNISAQCRKAGARFEKADADGAANIDA